MKIMMAVRMSKRFKKMIVVSVEMPNIQGLEVKDKNDDGVIFLKD